MAELTPALLKAQEARKARKESGLDADKHITFSGTDKVTVSFVDEKGDVIRTESMSEVAALRLAILRAGYTSMSTFVREVALNAALKEAGRAVKPRVEKSVEQLEAEKAALEAKIAKKKGA